MDEYVIAHLELFRGKRHQTEADACLVLNFWKNLRLALLIEKVLIKRKAFIITCLQVHFYHFTFQYLSSLTFIKIVILLSHIILKILPKYRHFINVYSQAFRD